MSTTKNRKTKNRNNDNIKTEVPEKSADCEDKLLERSKYSLDLVNTWINSADTKVSISCGMVSIIITVLTIGLEMILKSVETTITPNPCMISAFNIMKYVAAVSFLASIILHFMAIIPNLSGGNKNNSKSFSIFYEDIKNQESADKYIEIARKASEKDFTNEVLSEVYYNSKVCSGKMKKFRMAIICAIVSVVSVLCCGALYYFAY